MTREDPCEEGTLGQTLEGSEGAGLASFGETMFQALETKGAEALCWQYAWFV